MKRATLTLAALALLLGGVGQAKAQLVVFSQLNLYVQTQTQAGTTQRSLQDNAIGNSLATITHDGISLPGSGQPMGPPSAVATATAIQHGSQGSVVFNNNLLGISPGGFGLVLSGSEENSALASRNFKLTFTDSNASDFYFHYAVSSQINPAGLGDFGGEFGVFQTDVQVFDQTLSPNTAGDIVFPFAANQSYTVQMTAPAPNIGTDGLNISAVTGAVYNFGIGSLPGSSPDNPVIPMAKNGNGGYVFLPPTSHFSPTYIDPPLATGYDYSVTGQNFSSVVVPGPLADGQTSFILKFNGFTETLKAGTAFNFDYFVPGGVSTFTISGIDRANKLDPNNPRAFVTGLTYEGSGIATVTQTPLTSPVTAVPEPASLTLLGIGLASTAVYGWRRRRQSA